MNKKFLVMGAIALAVGGATVFTADYWLQSNVRTVVKEVVIEKPLIDTDAMPTIVVAAEPLSYGDLIEEGQLKEVPWAAGELPPGAFAKIDDMLADGGRAALLPIEVGEPLLGSKVTGPDGRPSLSAKLAPGMRAMSIQVSEFSAVAGFIVPGDRVDIVLTRTFDRVDGNDGDNVSERQLAMDQFGGMTGKGNTVSITTSLLDNIKVLTVDQVADERRADPVIVRAITVEIPPEYARVLAAAQTAGELSVNLRKAGDSGDEPILAVPAQSIDMTPTASYQKKPVETEVAAPIKVEPVTKASSRAQVIVRHGADIKTFDVTPEGTR